MFPCPKAGADCASSVELPRPSLLIPASVEFSFPLSLSSCELNRGSPPEDGRLVVEPDFVKTGGPDRVSRLRRDALVPAVAG